VRKEQILKRDEQREDDIAGNKPVAAKQDRQRFMDNILERMWQEIPSIHHRLDEPSVKEHGQQQQYNLFPVHQAIHHEIPRDQDKDRIAHIAAPIDELCEGHLPRKHINIKDTLRRFQYMKNTMHPEMMGNNNQHGDNPQ